MLSVDCSSRLWPAQRARLIAQLLPSTCKCNCSSRNVIAGASKGGPGPKQSNAKAPSRVVDAPPLDGSRATTPNPPPLTDAPSRSASTPSSSSEGQSNLDLKILWRRVLIDLSSLPRAIALMAATFGFSALGTFIPQNKAFEYYVENYPTDGDKVLGFLSYDLIFLLDLDHIYTAWYFYATLGWLAASLMACTTTRQWPAVKVAQRWRFLASPVNVAKQGLEKGGMAEVLPGARVQDLGSGLAKKDYQVFVQGPSLYAFKGLAGKLGPIGVHVALLLTLAGASYSGFGGYKGTAMVPEGQELFVADAIRPVSSVAISPDGASKILHVNKFNIDYRPDGSIAQFYSDLSLIDPSQQPTREQLDRATSEASSTGAPQQVFGREVMRKTISVNDPFRFGGLTMYQTDWSLSSLRVRIVDSGSGTPLQSGSILDLPMASLEGRPGINGRLWGSYLPVEMLSEQELQQGRAPRGISVLARDPESVIFYDTKGVFVGVRRPGSGKPIDVEGVSVVAEAVVAATGLEIKSDPGVPIVYAGFGGLMVTTLVSYLSHSQVWAVQEGTTLYVGGRSNRARLAFAKELNDILEEVPEVHEMPNVAVVGAGAAAARPEASISRRA